MSNTDLIISLYKNFGEKNVEALKEICAKDIVWTQNPGFPGGTISRGVEAIIKNVNEGNAGRWEKFSFRRDSITEAGDKVLVEGAYVVKSEKSANEVEAQACHVYEIKNGRVASFQQYTDSKTLWDNMEGRSSSRKASSG